VINKHITGRATRVPFKARIAPTWNDYIDVNLTVDLVPVPSYSTAYAAKGKDRDRKLPTYECSVGGVKIGQVHAYQGTSERHYNRIRVVTGHPIHWSSDFPATRKQRFGGSSELGHRTRNAAVYELVRRALAENKINGKGKAIKRGGK
jgi:hypothetical protein